jgi:polyribonucleotide nucleotidyltransferase
MDVGEEGDRTAHQGKGFVKALVAGSGAKGRRKRQERAQYVGLERVVGVINTGKVMGVHAYGVFAEILTGAEDGSTPGFEGLLHTSELARDCVRTCEGYKQKAWALMN